MITSEMVTELLSYIEDLDHKSQTQILSVILMSVSASSKESMESLELYLNVYRRIK